MMQTTTSAKSLDVSVSFPPVLDACCSCRQFWHDKNDKRALFMDNRKCELTVNRIGRKSIVIAPDVVADFTKMPFPSETFWHVVFDPPHHTSKRLGMSMTGTVAKSYGILLPGWHNMIRAGFEECFRVLKPHGTLIFKWCSAEIQLSTILELTPEKPLYGHISGKAAKTHWIAFLKSAAAKQGGAK